MERNSVPKKVELVHTPGETRTGPGQLGFVPAGERVITWLTVHRDGDGESRDRLLRLNQGWMDGERLGVSSCLGCYSIASQGKWELCLPVSKAETGKSRGRKTKIPDPMFALPIKDKTERERALQSVL